MNSPSHKSLFPAASSTNRRTFLRATGTAFTAMVASGCMRSGMQPQSVAATQLYGPLVPDPAGLIDLPEGFSYRVISQLGDAMSDGLSVPDKADGMGCFAMPDGRIGLVRNHELSPGDSSGGLTGPESELPAFDRMRDSGAILPGGTTTLMLNPETLQVEEQFRSLAGTIRNCAGGITPWGSWLTCEENVTRAKDAGSSKWSYPVKRDHGWVFEVPAAAKGLVDPVPLKAMGRFNHEAACVDPATGIVYLTEDRDDSLLYRFIPETNGRLQDGGRLQALAIRDVRDSRNWNGRALSVNGWHAIHWIDLDDVESPEDDLRLRGAANGALLFARGEGIHMGDGEFYFCCTSGGAAGLGQVFRVQPGKGDDGRLQLFFESESVDQFNFGDNLTVAPNGHLIVCEDQYTDVVTNHLRGIDRVGRAYPLALLHQQTEFAGACFSPDGATLFVNLYSPAKTLAISGPWRI
ncbi:alkaline phosphatase PhoX [Altericroceibacterium endophyticum]|uniref:DUF839 domain-containing protein n=1 Tax=Altericroceibacterium endophyticum TaxID=1808508 RepID=A0A6I4T8S8_9SPHN|nr:alkaline phosphatase PhoX [Altericroceibacterium endophyticum]MXO67217.1 DUF839 domain-containing protein [Altericroceibacterium endophyticum]